MTQTPPPSTVTITEAAPPPPPCGLEKISVLLRKLLIWFALCTQMGRGHVIRANTAWPRCRAPSFCVLRECYGMGPPPPPAAAAASIVVLRATVV